MAGRRLAVACVVAAALGILLAALASQGGDDDGPGAAEDGLPENHPALDASDQFAQLSVEELETEVADESAPVDLRLTLAERYLETGDLRSAQEQASVALDQAAPGAERQRALRDLGWAEALLGDAERGAQLLERALEIEPGELNATWYLANVRLVGLEDRQGAVELLERLLEADLTDDQREMVEARLEQANSTQ